VWLTPMVAAMAFDGLMRGRIHRVDVITTAVMAVAFLRILIMETERWRVIGRALLRPFL
jgi:hypothetical protein